MKKRVFKPCLPPINIVQERKLLVRVPLDTVAPPPRLCKICDGVYLGNHAEAMNQELLSHFEIKTILNIAIECANTEDSIQIESSTVIFPEDAVCVVRYDKEDQSDEVMTPVFFDAAIAIENNIQASRNVLVHCRGGHSRAPTIVVTYLMLKNGWNLHTAVVELQKEYDRELIINLGFTFQLEDLDKAISAWRLFVTLKRHEEPDITFQDLIREFLLTE